MNKSFIFINQTFYPDNSASSQHSTDLAILLVRMKYKVSAIADRRPYRECNSLFIKREKYKDIAIKRIRSFGFKHRTHLLRGIDYLVFSISLAKELCKTPKFSVVIALTTPPWIAFIGLIFARLKGSRFFHWAMDINPDEAIQLGWVREGSLFHRLLKWMMDLTYQKSDAIVVLDKDMIETIKRKDIRHNRIYTVSPWAQDEVQYVDSSENTFRDKYGLNEKTIIMYSGNFSICHSLDTVLNAAKELKEKPDYSFVFIGDGVRKKDIFRFRQNHQLSNIVYLPYQKLSDIKHSLSAADVHVVIMGIPFVGIVHPCKIYGILKLGTPFIYVGPKDSFIMDIIKDIKYGWHVEHGDVKGFINKVRLIRNMTIEIKEKNRKRVQEIAKKKYGKEKQLAKMLAVIENVLYSERTASY